MKVSIVIPTWNGKALLERNLPLLLQSIQCSSYPVEVIVVDDGGEDGSREFIADTFPQIKVVVHKTNRGFAIACHSGINEAQGEIVFLLNSDVIKNFNVEEKIVMVVVTHNESLASQTPRLITLKDGIKIGDTYPVKGEA